MVSEDVLSVYQEFVDADEFIPDEVVEALAAEVRALRKDTRRLDALDEDGDLVLYFKGKCILTLSFREVADLLIDAAMAEASKGGRNGD